MPPVWEWERTESGRPGMSGDLAKIFRHEDPKAPGILAVEAPTPAAVLLAREVIQNSWDAARELQGTDAHAPQFQIEFRFRDITGSDKKSLSDALALDQLAERVSGIDRHKLGLPSRVSLDDLTPGVPLRVLTIRETATTGMYGPWNENRSHMFLALLSIGFTEKLSGAGGSYGYGKAGLINASRIRSVVAYTCFRERADDPGISRRLLGVTYWGPHDFGGSNHPGIGTLSAGGAGNIRPFENEEADEFAARLGIPIRHAATPEDLGTTFLVIDTAVEPVDLVKAVERSWWPALHEGEFTVRLVDVDGSSIVPRPMRDPVLRTFIDAWELAIGRSEPPPTAWATTLTGPERSEDTSSVGTMGLVADLSDWSYADHTAGPDDQDVAHKSLVALTRGPRMIVEYLEVGHSPPYVRGVFIADPSVDELLRLTEPKAHDAWRTKPIDGEVNPAAAAMADHVIRRIKQTVNNHRNRLKPPVPPPEEVNLPFFNEIMQKVMSGMGKGVRQPTPDIRPISIHLDYAPHAASKSEVFVKGSATFGLTEHFVGDESEVSLSIAYRFLEDDRVGERVDLSIVAPDGFQASEPGEYHGTLTKGTGARFEFETGRYDAAWSGRLIVSGEVLKKRSISE